MNAAAIPFRQPEPRTEFSGLLATLFQQIAEMQALVVAVTSARSGEGVTTVTRDIAAAVAGEGRCRVALVYSDPSRPPPGDEAASMPSLVELSERGQEPRLRPRRFGRAVVDTGVLAQASDSDMRIESVHSVYGTFRTLYPITFVDCSPVLAGPHALVLSSAADQTILIVEAERTLGVDLAQARRVLEGRGASLLGLVLNKHRHRIPRFVGSLMS